MIFHTIRVIKSSMNHERTSLLHHRIRKIYKTEINIGMLPIPVTLGSESNVNILVVTGMVVCKQRNINIYCIIIYMYIIFDYVYFLLHYKSTLYPTYGRGTSSSQLYLQSRYRYVTFLPGVFVDRFVLP